MSGPSRQHRDDPSNRTDSRAHVSAPHAENERKTDAQNERKTGASHTRKELAKQKGGAGTAVVDTDLMIRQRNQLGWTQDGLADKAGVSRGTIQTMEKGDAVSYSSIELVETAMRTAWNDHPSLGKGGKSFQDIDVARNLRGTPPVAAVQNSQVQPSARAEHGVSGPAIDTQSLRQFEWVQGAFNHDEDLHFSSFYLRNSVQSRLKPELRTFGYHTVVAHYRDCNEEYFIPVSECSRVATELLEKIRTTPLWLQEIIDEIKARLHSLEGVFPYGPDSFDIRALSDEDLANLYREHNNAHMALYELARIPEALDRGVLTFTNYLKAFLKQRGPDLALTRTRNRVFESLTFPEEPSVVAKERQELSDLAESLSELIGRDTVASLPPGRLLLKLQPTFLKAVEQHRDKWAFAGYHGYSSRAVRDTTYFLERVAGLLRQHKIRPTTDILAHAVRAAEEHRQSLFAQYSIDATHQMLFRLYARLGVVKLERRFVQLRNFFFLDQLIAEVAKRRSIKEIIVRCLMPEEILGVINNSLKLTEQHFEREKAATVVWTGTDEIIYSGTHACDVYQLILSRRRLSEVAQHSLVGSPVFGGAARGRARVVQRANTPEAVAFRRGDILVAEATDPDLFPIMELASAVLTESGGVTCHAAIVCIELGVPAIVGIPDLLQKVSTGDLLRVDAFEGVVTLAKPVDPEHVVFDGDSHSHDPKKLGWKAVRLGMLRHSGFKVPPFFAVPVAALRIEAQTPVLDAISEALDYLPGELFAVRSSLSDEDSPERSNAGRYVTELHVNRADVVGVLVELVRYLDPTIVGSFIVQEMIIGECAGIVFTQDPVRTESACLVLEAAQGGNSGVTSGKVTPARWYIQRTGLSITKKENAGAFLTTAQIRDVCQVALAVEEQLGDPQDVEWAYAAGDLWLLQTRPLSVGGRRPSVSVEQTPQPCSRRITGIYRKYRVPPTLQEHMLQVAAVGVWICEHWKGNPSFVDRDTVVEVSLLHDVGNLMKVDYSRYPTLFPEPPGQIEYWRAVQSWLRSSYGRTETEATIAILSEIGVRSRVIQLVQEKQFVLNIATAKSTDWNRKICAYADQRVSPRGVTSLRRRVEEAVRRYAGVPSASVNHADRQALVTAAENIEQQIFEFVDGQPNDVDDAAINGIVKSLRTYDIRGSMPGS